jgi:hypothetical protein
MATSPTTQSALLSGAAKDDAVGDNGETSFTIADLLANDPGGAAKVNIDTQFFFGDSADDRDNQAQYLAEHGITYDEATNSYIIGPNATDFNYFVQIGNKGTWSVADVDVTAPPAEPHAGDMLFEETFDYSGTVPLVDPATNTTVAGIIDLSAANGWSGAGYTELGASGYGGISSGGEYWLDTQNSPGGIDISHDFVDPTGGQALLDFDISLQSLTFNNQSYETDPNALIEFKIDGTVVADFTHDELLDLAGGENQMYHFQGVVNTGAAGSHTFEIVDSSTAGYAGFAVDSIQIHDWLI